MGDFIPTILLCSPGAPDVFEYILRGETKPPIIRGFTSPGPRLFLLVKIDNRSAMPSPAKGGKSGIVVEHSIKGAVMLCATHWKYALM